MPTSSRDAAGTPLRRLVAVGWAITALLAASLASPVLVSASGTTSPPGRPGPHSGVTSPHIAAPSTGIRSPASVAAAPVVCDGQFDVVASPNGTGNNYLDFTSAVSANDVWAVGNSTNASNLDRTLAEHWNGATWSIVPTVNPGALHNDLFGVSAVSSSNVWAVGFYETNASTGTSSTIAEHWNGTSWSSIPPINPSTYSYLFAVTAIDSTHVWAVGTYYNFAANSGNGAYNTLTELWNGTSWAVEPSANTGFGVDSFNELFAVSAFSASDIWAVGSYSLAFGGTLEPIAEHFDGISWSVVINGGPLGGDNEMLGVAALEANHAVGVGYGGFVASTTPRQEAVWNMVAGGGSSTAALSGPGAGDNVLLAVDRSGGSVWAVGFWRSTVSSARQTLVLPAAWDSAAHSLTWGATGTSASPSTINQALFSVTAVSPSVFWATGYATSGTVDKTLAELYCGLHFNLGAPGTTNVGAPFSLTVTAANANGSTATGYRGTVHFSSSDPLAALPGDYTFTPGDSGAHTFTGVVLNTPYGQTIVASDTVTPFVTGSVTIGVVCPGACQGPAGTSGGRGANQSPSAPTPGPRVPNGIASHKARIGVQAGPPSTTDTPALLRGDGVPAFQPATGSPQAGQLAWNMELFAPLALMMFALQALRW